MSTVTLEPHVASGQRISNVAAPCAAATPGSSGRTVTTPSYRSANDAVSSFTG